MIVLDTDVISELMKLRPNPSVLTDVEGLQQDVIFTAAICEAEVRYGLARMPEGRRRLRLSERIETFFEAGFRSRVLSFDSACAAVYAELRRTREAAGRPISMQDAMIAATVRAHGAEHPVTRNTKKISWIAA